MFGIKRYFTLKIWFNAWRDARKDYPSSETGNLPHFIIELKTACECQLARLAAFWNEQEKRLMGEYQKAFERRQRALGSVKQIETRLKEARALLEDCKYDLDNLEALSPGRTGYVLFFIFLLVTEMPVNYIVFQVFGEPMYMTVLMSSLLCFILPWSAHLMGMTLKEGLNRNPVRWIKVISCLILTAGLLGAIAYVRQGFFNGSSVQDFLGIRLDQDTITVLFFSINSLAFLTATWTSYCAHPSNPQTYRNILAHYTDAQKNVHETEKLLEGAVSELELASNELNDIISRRLKGFHQTRDKAVSIIKNWDNDVRYYFKVNVRHRRDKKDPVSFHNEIDYFVSSTLESLDWDWTKEMITSLHETHGLSADQKETTALKPLWKKELKAVQK